MSQEVKKYDLSFIPPTENHGDHSTDAFRYITMGSISPMAAQQAFIKQSEEIRKKIQWEKAWKKSGNEWIKAAYRTAEPKKSFLRKALDYFLTKIH